MERANAVQQITPRLRLVRAPNPSPMTHTGTNSYIVGRGGDVVVIDPGPVLDAHRGAILAALAPGERIAAILVTHSHRDHSPLARPLAAITGAPIWAAGPSDWGRSTVMQTLAAQGGLEGGEGVDTYFTPDQLLRDGDTLTGAWGEIQALETPGHMANHLCFAWDDALFSGDLVMGWATSLVSPPDGDMRAFMASLARLTERTDRIFYPGHGPAVTDPQSRLAELIAHRQAREAQILEALRTRPGDASDLAQRVYTDIPSALLPAASRNTLAHLIDLYERKIVGTQGDITAHALFHLV